MIKVRAGKGDKSREVPMTPRTEERVNAWRTAARISDGLLFCSVRKGGKIKRDARLGDKPIYQILERRARAAGVKKFSPHDTRRTFASDALDAGIDLSVVQRLMGHSSPETTARYDRRGERAGVKGIRRLTEYRDNEQDRA